jgi:hypothetical protein
MRSSRTIPQVRGLWWPPRSGPTRPGAVLHSSVEVSLGHALYSRVTLSRAPESDALSEC